MWCLCCGKASSIPECKETEAAGLQPEQRQSRGSSQGFQSKHSLCTAVRHRATGRWAQSWALPCAPPAAWTLSQPGLSCLQSRSDDAQTTLPPSPLPPHFFLGSKTLLTATTNVTFEFMAKKFHPYCTPVSTIFIREAFELCSVDTKQSWIGVKV